MNSFWQGLVTSLRGDNQVNPPYISPFLHQLMVEALSMDESTLMLSWHDLGLSRPNVSRAIGKSGRAFEPQTTHLGQGHFSHQEQTESLGALSADDAKFNVPRLDTSRLDAPRFEEQPPISEGKNVKTLSSDGQQTRMHQQADSSLIHFSTEASNEKTGAHSEKLTQIRADFKRSALADKQKVDGDFQGRGEYVHKKAHFQLPPNLQSSPTRRLNEEAFAWGRQTQKTQVQADSVYSAQAASDIHHGLDSKIDSDFYAGLDSGFDSGLDRKVQADLDKLSTLKKLESKIITRLNQRPRTSNMPLTSWSRKASYPEEDQGSRVSKGSDGKQGRKVFGSLQERLAQNVACGNKQTLEAGSSRMHEALTSYSDNKAFQLFYRGLSDGLIQTMCHQGTEVQRRQIDEREVKSVLNGLAQQVQTGLMKRLALDARWAASPQQNREHLFLGNSLGNDLGNSLDNQGRADIKADAHKIPDETVTAYLVSSLREHLATLRIEPRHPQDEHGKSLDQYLTKAVFQQANLSQLTEGIRRHLLMDNQGAMFGSGDDHSFQHYFQHYFQHRGEAPARPSAFEPDFFSQRFITAREEYGARLSTLFDNMRMKKSKVAMALSKARALSLLSDLAQGLAQGLNRSSTGRLNHLSPWGHWLSSLSGVVSGVGSRRQSSIFPECTAPMLLDFDAVKRRVESSFDKSIHNHDNNMVNDIESYLSPLAFIENSANWPSKQALGLKTGLNSVTSGLLLNAIQTALSPLGKSGSLPPQYSPLQPSVISSLLLDLPSWMQNGKALGDEFKHLERRLFALNKGLASQNEIEDEAVRELLIRRLHQFSKPDSSVLPHWHNIHDVNGGLKHFGLEGGESMVPILEEQNGGNTSEDNASVTSASLEDSFSSSDTSPLLIANADSPLSTLVNTVNGYRHQSHIHSEYQNLIKNHARVPLTDSGSRERADLRLNEPTYDTESRLTEDEKLIQAHADHNVSQVHAGDGKPVTLANTGTSLTRIGQASTSQASTSQASISQKSLGQFQHALSQPLQSHSAPLQSQSLPQGEPHDLPLSNTRLNSVQPHERPLSNIDVNSVKSKNDALIQHSSHLNMPLNNEVSGVSPAALATQVLPLGKDKSSDAAQPSPVRLNVGRIIYNRPGFSVLKSAVKKRPRPTMTLSDYNQRLRGNDE
ncbi:hypothetical protein [uncultured Shewanella sp.]|uniref:hypothetical protein n=1 Tax=uncultured Shewanella sp. TaxID=173975 RepID=UPI00262EDB6F|nr:hypothetical protein [uncultured Shewanella sp.]